MDALERCMKSIDLVVGQTGGGCTAYVGEVTLMITDEGGGCAPISMIEPILVGLYDKDGVTISVKRHESMLQFLRDNV